MAENSKIEWADRVWNFLAGCSLASPGCTNCYAQRQAARIERMNPGLVHYKGLTKPSKAGPVWTGKIGFAEHKLIEPLRVRKPARWFVNSMSDLFHEDVPDEVIDRAFAVMALAPQHVFQVLTKRSKRMREYMEPFDRRRADALGRAVLDLGYAGPMEALHWPLPNVCLGVSVEDQKRADERIPDLLATPAAVRWISAEPLLGPVDLTWVSEPDGRKSGVIDALLGCNWIDGNGRGTAYRPTRPGHEGRVMTRHVVSSDAQILKSRKLDWVAVGGESGPKARPSHPDWFRSIRDQCTAAGVPMHFKQWGEFCPSGLSAGIVSAGGSGEPYVAWPDGTIAHGNAPEHGGSGTQIVRLGKSRAGRLLDGIEHNGFPGSGA